DYEWERREHELEFQIQVQTGNQRGDSREEIITDEEFDDELLLPAELTLEDEEELEREVSVELDYTRPLGEEMSFEVGYELQFEDSDSERLIHFIDDPAADPDGITTDRGFDQSQTTNSAYTT